MITSKDITTQVKNPELVQRRHRQIVDAAVQLFIKHGFHKTTTRQIAKAAGFSGVEVHGANPDGRLVVTAILNRDYPVVQATLMLVVLIFLLTNIIVDLLYGYLDPRVRFEQAQ